MRKTGRENAGESCSLMRILTEHITGLEKGMREKGRYILGIDQGGTKTAAVLMREDGVLLGKGKARGAYFPTQGMNGALIDREGRQFIYGDYMDENVQGGSALALRAARKVFDAQLGLSGETALTPLFLAHAKVEDVDALLRRYMMEDGFRGKLRYLVPDIMRIAARFPGAQVVSARYEPEVGACIMGLQHQGLEAAKREEAMRESAAALGVLRS